MQAKHASNAIQPSNKEPPIEWQAKHRFLLECYMNDPHFTEKAYEKLMNSNKKKQIQKITKTNKKVTKKEIVKKVIVKSKLFKSHSKGESFKKKQPQITKEWFTKQSSILKTYIQTPYTNIKLPPFLKKSIESLEWTQDEFIKWGKERKDDLVEWVVDYECINSIKNERTLKPVTTVQIKSNYRSTHPRINFILEIQNRIYQR